MGREAKITYEQVTAAAEAMCAANIRPSSRTIRERLGNAGSMGTINRFLQEWKATQDRRLVHSLTLPPGLQGTILDFVAQEISAAKAQLESALVELRQEMADLATENERQAADIEERINAEAALRAELATLQGRILQTEGELDRARRETIGERENAANAGIDAAKARLRLEAMARLETDLAALREELKAERQERAAASQQAAVLGAKLEAARERAAQAMEFEAEIRAAAISRDLIPRGTPPQEGADRRRKTQAKS